MTDEEQPNVAAWLASASAASLLPSLVLAPDDDTMLRGFIRRTRNPALTVAQARIARRMLIQVCGALASKRPEDWRALQRAVDATSRIAVPPPSWSAEIPPPPPVDVEAPTEAEPSVGTAPPDVSPAAPEHPVAAAPPPKAYAAAPPAAAVAPSTTPSIARPPPSPAAAHAPVQPPPAATALAPGAPVETEAIDLAAVAEMLVRSPSALPFTMPKPGAGPPPALASSTRLPAQTGHTEGIDHAAVEAAVGGSFPLAAPEAEQLPLAIEQYAALRAREEAGTPTDLLHREYRIHDVAHRKRVDASFAEVFQQRPNLRTAFDHSLEQWRQYLRAPRG